MDPHGGGGDVVGGVGAAAGLGRLAGVDAVRRGPVGRHVHERHEVLVGDVAVVALQVVLDDVLPVGGDVVAEPAGEREVGDVGCLLGDLGAEVTRLQPQRGRRRVEVHEHEPGELLHLYGVEADARRIEVHEVLRVAGGDQRAVEVVGPAVVGAPQRADRTLADEDLVRPVLAHVVEGPQFSVAVAHQNDGKSRNRRRDVIAGRCEPLPVAHPLPIPGEDGRLLEVVPALGGIGLGVQGTRRSGILGVVTTHPLHVGERDRRRHAIPVSGAWDSDRPSEVFGFKWSAICLEVMTGLYGDATSLSAPT